MVRSESGMKGRKYLVGKEDRNESMKKDRNESLKKSDLCQYVTRNVLGGHLCDDKLVDIAAAGGNYMIG